MTRQIIIKYTCERCGSSGEMTNPTGSEFQDAGWTEQRKPDSFGYWDLCPTCSLSYTSQVEKARAEFFAGMGES